MKKIVSFLLALMMTLSLCACSENSYNSDSDQSNQQPSSTTTNQQANTSTTEQQNNQTNEEKGVPQKQLEAEIYPSSTRIKYTVTNCTHNVDTILHQDEIVLEYYADYKYLRTDNVIKYIYRYDRTTDIWTLISKGERNYNHTLKDSLKGTKWTGTTDATFYTVYYTVTVEEINTMDGWIQFSYDIDFAGKNYTGTEYIEYGEFSTSVENMFNVYFDVDDGFTVYRG